jgi:hypothetical protein
LPRHLWVILVLRCGVLVRVHGRHARVVLVRDEVVVVRYASCPRYLHAWVLLLLLWGVAVGVHGLVAQGRCAVVLGGATGREAVSVVVILLLQGVIPHVLAEVGKRGGSLELMGGVAHHGSVV